MLNSYNSKVLLGAGSRPKFLSSQSLKSQEGKGWETWKGGAGQEDMDLQIIHASRNSVTSFCNLLGFFFVLTLAPAIRGQSPNHCTTTQFPPSVTSERGP